MCVFQLNNKKTSEKSESNRPKFLQGKKKEKKGSTITHKKQIPKTKLEQTRTKKCGWDNSSICIPQGNYTGLGQLKQHQPVMSWSYPCKDPNTNTGWSTRRVKVGPSQEHKRGKTNTKATARCFYVVFCMRRRRGHGQSVLRWRTRPPKWYWDHLNYYNSTHSYILQFYFEKICQTTGFLWFKCMRMINDEQPYLIALTEQAAVKMLQKTTRLLFKEFYSLKSRTFKA